MIIYFSKWRPSGRFLCTFEKYQTSCRLWVGKGGAKAEAQLENKDGRSSTRQK
jgi:hypothetical protein